MFDFLLGKKKTITHPILGKLTSDRIRGKDKTKIYSWSTTVVLEPKAEKTSIFLEGNESGPFANHLNFASQLVENWKSEFISKLALELAKGDCGKIEKNLNWKEDFYLAAIYPMNGKSLDFEVSLESIDSSTSNVIGIFYKNDIITSIEEY
ncbi:hypothetical protein M4I21_00540 [Cellulophaga sp. 20_2_10]|uniref:hypothetical protein n=1 Tax=Cellulophaga sp. 20_2_10 TaxID=2942476 RepID=UPI00201B19B2|nr:hypothetical protein [Cellulophaga sp. 20_2_10]MCL5244276.1 hypothetical protein [Cellulophaga sp. 20_2_10]